MRAGRFARAVMFAGMTLTGCDQGGGKPDKPIEDPVVKEPIPVPRLQGTVTETSSPLVGAEVILTGPGTYRTLTDHRGRYAFNNIQPGLYQLRVSYRGDDPNANNGSWGSGQAEREVTIKPGADAREDVKLAIAYEPPAMPYGAPPARRRIV